MGSVHIRTYADIGAMQDNVILTWCIKRSAKDLIRLLYTLAHQQCQAKHVRIVRINYKFAGIN